MPLDKHTSKILKTLSCLNLYTGVRQYLPCVQAVNIGWCIIACILGVVEASTSLETDKCNK